MTFDSRREPPDPPPPEVRRCAACGAAAMIPVQVWQHTGTFARAGQQTLDCRCQSCGASVTLVDPKVIKDERQAGLFLAWTLIFPAIYLPRAKRQAKAWADHPVVPGAPMPPLKFDRPQATRRCGTCGNEAQLVNLEENRINGIPSGTERTYRCRGCGAEFTTESPSGVISNLFGAFLFIGGGLVAVTEAGSAPFERYALGPGALLAGVWFAWQALKAILVNRKNR